ncbi:oxidoreductase CipA-like protein [Massariosphaeria phaeospora]|uniref:Oxidoreductase CipA-like protein n=1 Tax=Massariosphaeria phaeospora TaxID=100035 RepID=A0A7C8MCZ8_9PLEO|nr:oxidoreductase CipA-like protein [Massariosphaeria phaeospora]
MPPTRVAIAGATGNLGIPLLHALLAADYSIIALSRVGGNSSKLKPHPNLLIKEVDFTAIDSLASALSGVEVVVSCLATTAIGSQNPLIDASVAAGVKRFIPAEFGMDSQNALAMQLPVCVPKVATQKYLLEKSNTNPGFTYTGIANGMFLDWGLQVGMIADVAKHTATLYNGGDVPFSATTLADVVKAVCGVIGNQDQTANRIVYVHSAVVTQKQLIRYAKEKDGKEWETTVKKTEDIRLESLAELGKGSGADIETAMLGFCICALWDLDYGCDFSGHLDNELLGVEEMGEADLRGIVENSL